MYKRESEWCGFTFCDVVSSLLPGVLSASHKLSARRQPTGHEKKNNNYNNNKNKPTTILQFFYVNKHAIHNNNIVHNGLLKSG
jgi:hypothetical protein